MEEDEDDMYAPEEEYEIKTKTEPLGQEQTVKNEAMGDDEDEDYDDDDVDDDDSDIEIVTEAKPGAKPEAPSQAQRAGPTRTGESVPVKPESPAPGSKPAASTTIKLDGQKRSSEPQKPGSSYPAIHTSTIDLDVKPIHEVSGKAITEIDMDADFGEDDKPWRRPGSDQTDYFNYGFDEFTWASYCLKQEALRKEAKDQKKQLEDMQNFMGLGGGAPTAPGGIGMGMGGPGDFPPEMQQMMQQMMQSGVDPSQMDFNQFMQMMGQGGQQNMGGGFGQNQQQMGGFGGGFGSGGGGGGGGHGGHGGGRGRGRGRW